jgi:hypothetical protein
MVVIMAESRVNKAARAYAKKTEAKKKKAPAVKRMAVKKAKS